jgi:hypothetical protein
VSGSEAIAGAGISSIGDLLEFDHSAFWERSIRLHQLPTFTKLGRMLGSHSERVVSGSALRKRAKKFIESCCIEGQFFMHNAVRKHPSVARRFGRIPLGQLMPLAVECAD